ncbi:hypothetical protein GCT19_09335 [Paraburkholderia sp. CNPSo 3155]|nr:hypothetical protein [Paraburkholderia atlantica]
MTRRAAFAGSSSHDSGAAARVTVSASRGRAGFRETSRTAAKRRAADGAVFLLLVIVLQARVLKQRGKKRAAAA